VLGLQPRAKAKKYLYDLFRKLGKDFNGDLFSDNLDAEAETGFRLIYRSFGRIFSRDRHSEWSEFILAIRFFGHSSRSHQRDL
jgi:hypothetical protein